MAIVDRPTELSDEVLKSVEKGQRAAIEAVHTFVDTVDEKLPALGEEHPSMRQEGVDAALDTADRLVHTQYDFLREVVQSAGKSLGASAKAKRPRAETGRSRPSQTLLADGPAPL